MSSFRILSYLAFSATVLALLLTSAIAADRPNVVLILADDMGVGDVSAFFPDRLHTPAIDALAEDGVAFLHARAPASVCTPTRYSVLTGQHLKSTWLDHGVLTPYGSALIRPGQWTLPLMLRARGYNTAAVGKWHLGFDWLDRSGRPAAARQQGRDEASLWLNQPYRVGPLDVGFGSYFGVDAPNYPPYAFVRDRRIHGVLSGHLPPDQYGTPGRAVAGWNVHSVYGRVEAEALRKIGELASRPAPFFLYLALTGPHVPLSPAPDLVGKSGIGPYGDYVLTIDRTVERIVRKLRMIGELDNTIIVFSSDNGSHARAGNHQPAGSILAQHRANGPLRGLKATPYEGGLRVPLIVSWPGRGLTGERTTRRVSLIDLAATLADLTGSAINSQQVATESRSFAASIVPGTPERGSAWGRTEARYGQDLLGHDVVVDACWKLIDRDGQPPEVVTLCNAGDREMTDWAPLRPGMTAALQAELDVILARAARYQR